ncbi:hypothetical protein [Micromonospora cremea]|uniref:Uncharacterized protein n=1 Tax=Micromonospora cremea TaxID=709881 RepID=A0A1N6BDR1_9ACTN|nr:hypothetical protein [Micromonospora cremea]SIN44418.1 hypothetical protein SAMN04489832_7248 [Micromonospora cremea]
MTTVSEDAGDGPRIHAFVVGIGYYPHCERYPPGTPEGRLAADLTAVTTAPASALARHR